MRRDWWAPLTGVLFIVVLIVGFIIGGEPPDADEPVREIVQHYVDDKDSIQIGAALTNIALALLVFFGAVLRQELGGGTPEGQRSILPRVAFAGTIVMAVGGAIDATISFALAEAAEDVDPVAVQALQALWDNDFLPLSLGSALLLLGAGLAIVRYRTLPAWLGWVAVVLGVLGLTPIGYFSFMIGALWVIAVSVMLTLRRRSPEAAPAA